MLKKEIKRILIADDKKPVLLSLELLLEDYFDEVVCVSNPNLIPNLVWEKAFDVYLLDMNFSAGVSTGNEGLFWLEKIRENDRDAVVVFITAYGDVELAVKAVKEGAFDFVLKPWENQKLIATLKAAFKFRQSKNKINTLTKKEAVLRRQISGTAQMIRGASPGMQRIYSSISKVANTDANILITGENGTGKELIAREIHRNSLRKNEIFLTVDIATLPHGLVESELFGHVKGAYTGATGSRAGKFEAASGGTIFLDEIGNLDLQVQAKLLSVLQNNEVTPLGSNDSISTNIRLICATNHDLQKMINDGSFREDLYYRINTVIIDIPPLRERKEDIIPIANHYIEHFSKKYSKGPFKLNGKAIISLENYGWPGNVRELRHTVEKAVIFADSKVISDKDFQIQPNTREEEQLILLQPLEQLERAAIEKAIRHFKGNLTRVATELKVSRQTLYNKIKRHGL
nr:sigma-54-dependent Fis family transcriptional regulator [Bacteroidota bacterium]